MPKSRKQSQQLFPHPFSKAYWRQAFAEFRDIRVLVFAALMIALRVIFKPISIPIGVDLRIGTSFIINAFGAMVFGPVVAVAAAAVTDTLGAILFPTGTYFFPFIFTEIAGSVLFALFLYRTNISVVRVILCRFSINFFVNIVLQTPIMMLYYQLIMGKYYAPFDLLRIVKNLVLFPFEAVVLIILMNLIVPRLQSMGFTLSNISGLKFTRRSIAMLVALFLAGAAAFGAYCAYAYEHTSLSASYTKEERAMRNRSMTDEVLLHHSEMDSCLAIIDSAYPSLFSDQIHYQCTVYVFDADAVLERSPDLTEDEALAALYAYSRTPASKDEALTSIGKADIITRKDGTPLSYSDSIGLTQ